CFALPVHVAFVIGLADVQGDQQVRLRIGQQVDRETELVAKGFVRADIILAYANHGNAETIKSRPRSGERLSLDRAARGVVLGVHIQNEPFACEVAQRARFAVLIGKRKIREAVSGVEHECLRLRWFSKSLNQTCSKSRSECTLKT